MSLKWILQDFCDCPIYNVESSPESQEKSKRRVEAERRAKTN